MKPSPRTTLSYLRVLVWLLLSLLSLPAMAQQVTITHSGTGTGTVTSDVTGIDCGTTCQATFTVDANVTLTAEANEDSVFVGWSGDCSGSTSSLNLTMSSNFACTVQFDARPTTSSLTLLQAYVDQTDGIDGLSAANGVVISPDGKHVYAVGYDSNAVSLFNRDSQGLLSYAGSVQNSDIGSGLTNPYALSLTPDGKNLYVTSLGDNSVAVFSRDLNNGTLGLIEVHSDLLNLSEPVAITVSPDNTWVYVAARGSNSLLEFLRNVDSGELTLTTSYTDGVNGVEGIASPRGVAVSQDSQFIYVTGNNDNAVAVFQQSTGFVERYKDSENGVDNLVGAFGVTVSSDDKHVYVVSSTDNALVVFRRDTTDGRLTYLAAYRQNDADVDGLSGVRRVISNPHGREVYVSSPSSNSLVVFSRQVNSGLLTFNKKITHGVGGVASLSGLSDLVLSPDGTNIYTTAMFSNALTAFSVVAADLNVVLDDNGPVEVDSSIIFTAVVNNAGPDTASNVILSTQLPATTHLQNFDNSRGTCTTTLSGEVETVSCTLGDLGNGEQATLTLTANTPVDVGSGQLSTQASVSSNLPDPDSTDNTTSLNSVLQAQVPKADLEVTLGITPTGLGPNTAFTYDVAVHNAGDSAANNLVVTLILSEQLTLGSLPSECTGSLPTLTCSATTLAVGQSQTFSVPVTAPSSAATLNATVTVNSDENDPVADNNNASRQDVIEILPVNLQVQSVTATPNSVRINDTITFTVPLSNASPNRANNVVLTGALPSQLRYDDNESRCQLDSQTNNVICNLDIIDAFATSTTNTISLQTTAIQASQVVGDPITPLTTVFSITSSGEETDASDNAASANVSIDGTGFADIEVLVEADKTSVLVNENVTFTVTVSNSGPSPADVQLSGSLAPSDVTIVSVSNSCVNGVTISCALDAMQPGPGQSYTLEVRPTAAGTLQFTANATVAEPIVDQTPDNSRSISVSVGTVTTDLSVTGSAAPSPVFLGNTLAYTLVASNAGADATNVKIDLILPAEVSYANQFQNALGDCLYTEAERRVSCGVGNLADGASATVVVTVTAPATNIVTLQATASVSSDTVDTTATNDSITISTEVEQATANIGITGTATQDPILVENPITYQLGLNSTGPDSATDVTLSYTLPANSSLLSAVFVPASAGSCTLNVDQVTCVAASLSGGLADVEIVVQPSLAGNFSSTFTVSSLEFDDDESNNSLTLTSVVQNPATLLFLASQANDSSNQLSLSQVTEIALSPDANHLYATGYSSNAVAVFSRNSSNGRISFVQALFDGASGITGLGGASSIAISDDGAYLYVTGFLDNALSVFQRDDFNGSLTLLTTYVDGSGGVDGLAGAFDVVMMDNSLYVAGRSDNAISIFQRNSDGTLTYQSLVTVESISQLAAAPDNLHLYAISSKTDTITVFSRAQDGRLTPASSVVNNLSGVLGLDNVQHIAFSPDGNHAYTVASTDSAVVHFNRNTSTGALTWVAQWRNGTDSVAGLTGASAVALSPNGQKVYVAGGSENALAVFNRDSTTGTLSFIEEVHNGVNSVVGLAGVRSLVSGPNGVFLYAGAQTDNAITILQLANADISLSLRDTPDPIELGDSTSYIATVTNNGPSQATNVSLTFTVPPHSGVPSVTLQNTGRCEALVGNQLTCYLGLLDVGASTNATLVLTPTEVGNTTVSATASSTQLDPNAPNTAQETTQIIATAELGLALQAQPNPGILFGDVTLTTTVRNSGPDTASGIQLISTLPDALRFMSADVAGDTTTCSYVDSTLTVTCQLADLSIDTEQLVNIVVEPQSEGFAEFSVNVTSETVDPTTPNSAILSLSILSNQIDTTLDNTGQVLQDYRITPNGAVTGGSLGGTILNDGLLYDITIAAGAIVQGGKLSRLITNNGTLQDVTFLAYTEVIGGQLSGTIQGSAIAATRLQNVSITAGTQISNVIIDAGSHVDPEAVIGDNVVFVSNDLVPEGLDLTTVLPTIIEPISGSVSVNLRSDVLSEGSLLSELQAYLDLDQDTSTGVMSLETEQGLLGLLPLSVTQTTVPDAPSFSIQPDGNAVFITANGRQITAVPAVHDMSALLQGMVQQTGRQTIIALSNGNLRIEDSQNNDYLLLRPAAEATLASVSQPLGLLSQPGPWTNALNQYVLRFSHTDGSVREQILYATAAYEDEIDAIQADLPNVSGITYHNDGTLTAIVDSIDYHVVYAYKVELGAANGTTQLLPIKDQDGDDNDDFQVVYRNGERQVLYIVPRSELVTALQAIPAVQASYSVVQAEAYDQVYFNYGSEQALLAVTQRYDLPSGTSSGLTLLDDGQVQFITTEAQQIDTQPQVQDMAQMQAALPDLDLQPLDNGNVMAQVGDLTYYVRPALFSQETTTNLLAGLQITEGVVSNTFGLQLIFGNSIVGKRVQALYPVARDAVALTQFFNNLPNLRTLTLSNDGHVTVDSDGLAFNGIFAYSVAADGVASGGIQLKSLADVNGDAIQDYQIIYADGNTQIIYQLP